MGNDFWLWPNVRVIRIEFTAQDIARTRITTTFGPFAETLLGLGSLRMARRDRIAPPWRKVDRATAEVATFLSPHGLAQIDLFTLTGPAEEFGAAAQALLGVPGKNLTAEISAVHRCNSPGDPRWLAGIRRAEQPARRQLVDALHRTHSRMVEPHWPAMRTALEAERARLQRELTGGGVDRLLSTFHRQARWESAALELPTAGRWSQKPMIARLEGRGLVLVPSVLCPVGPVPFFPHEGDGPAILLYPVETDLVTQTQWWRGRDGTPGSSLATLLGHTRAAALEEIARGCTTTELAKRLGVSAASASQHAKALREAGLVASMRDRNRMLHSVTRLGTHLLEAADRN
jgi:DNA-binding transcriptional ArsR family regulator